MNSSNTSKDSSNGLINAEYLTFILCAGSAIALIVTLVLMFGTIFNGGDASLDLENNLWVKTVTPTTVCLLIFGIMFYFYFIRMNTSKAQLAIFILSFLSISLSMLALSFSMFQVSITKV
jgi:hypothetical protein